MVEISIHILFSDIVVAGNKNEPIYVLQCSNSFNNAKSLKFLDNTPDIKTANFSQSRSHYDQVLMEEQSVKLSIQVKTVPADEDLMGAKANRTGCTVLGHVDFKLDLNSAYVGRPQWMWLEVLKEEDHHLIGRLYVQVCAKLRNQTDSAISTTEESSEWADEDTISEFLDADISSMTIDPADCANGSKIIGSMDLSLAESSFVSNADRNPSSVAIHSTPCRNPRRIDRTLSSPGPSRKTTMDLPPKATRSQQARKNILKHKKSYLNVSTDWAFFNTQDSDDISPVADPGDLEISRQNQDAEDAWSMADSSISLASLDQSLTAPSLNKDQCNSVSPVATIINLTSPVHHDPCGRLVTNAVKSIPTSRRKRRSFTLKKK